MRELNEILELWRALEEAGESAVLATVLRTEGSSYRLPGARLLAASNGRHAGGVSGGCLEDDILKKAWWLTANGPILRKYDTTAEGEIAAGGYGLGCNGIIYVLLERVTASDPGVLPLLHAVKARRRPATIAHVVFPTTAAGERLAIDTDANVTHNFRHAEIATQVFSQVCESSLGSSSRVASGLELFVEKLTPPTRLLIFGAGDDAIPLTRLASCLGWQVSVFDGRAHYAKAEKFPLADQVVVRPAGSPSPSIDAWTVAVVMSHSYSQDLDVLRTLASQRLRYLGVLGPRKRTQQLISESGLEERIVYPALHAPMGLDLGGHGPEQVALAVVSEIQSVLNGRSGGFLGDRSGPIHGDTAHTDEANEWVHSIVCA